MADIKVFLSHKNDDSEIAGLIARRLKDTHQIEVYLDVIDRNLGKTGPDMADYIRAEMENALSYWPLSQIGLENLSGYLGKSALRPRRNGRLPPS